MMKKKAKFFRYALLMVPIHALCAPPEPGAVLQPNVVGQPPQPADRNAGKFVEQMPSAAPAGSTGDAAEQDVARIQIAAFVFDTDFSELDESELSQAILDQEMQDAVGKRLSLRELQLRVAVLDQRLKTHYGYLQSKAWLPLQEIREGKVTVKILKGTLGEVKTSANLNGTRHEEAMLNMAQTQLTTGKALKQANVEAVAYRATDYYGTLVRVVLIPTQELGRYDVMLEPQSTDKITGYVGFDNTGNRYTSQWHDNTFVKVNDLTGRADSLALGGQFLTPQQTSARLRYQMPTADGWTMGADVLYARYELGGDFASLRAKGHSEGYSFDAMRRVARSRDWNWQWGGALQQRRTTAEQAGATVSERKLTSVQLKTLLDWSGQADHSLQASWSSGQANLAANATDKQNDAASAKVDGRYNKWVVNYLQIRPVMASSQWRVNLTGQAADKNLDSSEKLSMGGLSGVRAYPFGEAMSDQGLVAQIEISQPLSAEWRWGVFYDKAYSQRNKKPWASTNVPNHYALSGYGLSVTWQPKPNATVQAIAARQLGSNPGADSTTLAASDGRNSRNRAWLVATLGF